MDQRQQGALALYISFEAQQQTRTDKAIDSSKSSSLADGRQEFHLHYTPLGLNSGPLFILI
jgi:hypothetical protein